MIGLGLVVTREDFEQLAEMARNRRCSTAMVAAAILADTLAVMRGGERRADHVTVVPAPAVGFEAAPRQAL